VPCSNIKHGGAQLDDRRDRFEYPLHHDGGHAAGGLVEHRQLAMGHNPPLDCKHALYAATQGVGYLLESLGVYGEKNA